MTYAPNHLELLKTNPKALLLYRQLVARRVKPADAFRKVLREVK